MFDFSALLRLEMPADDDIDDVFEVRLEVTRVVLGNHNEHLCYGNEAFGVVFFLEEIFAAMRERRRDELFCQI